ncbi:uncharacterized protein PHALS_11991 [Plasmopara halstedii]|uniref:Uncharacterized protein n=1 Tax=Plasmopara halstedii TaxID=4781 RepID=A0A0P1AKL5_PLAHL|nr:uncharacterized protein PHALS_11991 [Plasmopara halstedii]CEG41660.1 hypothetical protein PHALS_11991 [Plasmopara halstedii]|eukprot:XP_024578029.1 hypothetical protein PHALS_11991 [Plasmopara halstedii]
MRSTSSGNYYNVPISVDAMTSCELAPDTASFEHKTMATAWGTTNMRRLLVESKRRNLNAALDSVTPSKDPHTFRPTFAFDLNMIVASLTKGSDTLSNNSSISSLRSQVEPVPEPEISRIPVPSEAAAPQQRGRRGALSGEDELARSYAPSSSTTPENSIITYSLNKRKQKRLAAKALAAASLNGPNFEVAVVDAGNEHQPHYASRYVPNYQADATTVIASRTREPSLDQQIYAL